MDNPFNLPVPRGIDFKRLESRLDGDWIIGSDLHLPYHSLQYMTDVLHAAEHFNIQNLFLGGDTFNFGYLSKWEQTYEAYMGGESLDTDLVDGRQLVRAVLDKMTNLVMEGGNHDRRLQAAVRNKISTRAMFGLFVPDSLRERVYVPVLPYAWIDTPKGSYRITHPQAYSINTLSVPMALADKHHCHIVAAHGHHFGVGMDRSGQYVVAESGGLFDKARADYLYLKGDNRNPVWSNGFLVLKEGRLIPFGEVIG